jgi:hypothetical protein
VNWCLGIFDNNHYVLIDISYPPDSNNDKQKKNNGWVVRFMHVSINLSRLKSNHLDSL